MEIVIRTVKSTDLDAGLSGKRRLPAGRGGHPRGLPVPDRRLPGVVFGWLRNRDAWWDCSMVRLPGNAFYLRCHLRAGRSGRRGEGLAILGLAVLPEYRRNGVAAQLMKAYLAKARQAGKRRVVPSTCKEKLDPLL